VTETKCECNERVERKEARGREVEREVEKRESKGRVAEVGQRQNDAECRQTEEGGGGGGRARYSRWRIICLNGKTGREASATARRRNFYRTACVRVRVRVRVRVCAKRFGGIGCKREKKRTTEEAEKKKSARMRVCTCVREGGSERERRGLGRKEEGEFERPFLSAAKWDVQKHCFRT